MSPEQATGKPVNRRTDLWAFGVTLMEMLTGRRVFFGETISDVIAAVLKTEPDWAALPPDTPASVGRLLRRCLDKDPKRRLESAGDARLELDERDSDGPDVPGPRRPVLVAWLTGVALGLAIGSLATVAWSRFHSRPMSSEAEVTRLSFAPPAGVDLSPDATSAVISPDGRMVVMAIGPWPIGAGLWVRSLDALAPHPLVGTRGGSLPFWSPDGRHVGFFADQKLKTVDLQNGHVEEICAAPNGVGGAWNRDGVILFASTYAGPLLRVAASGGTPAVVVPVAARGRVEGIGSRSSCRTATISSPL